MLQKFSSVTPFYPLSAFLLILIDSTEGQVSDMDGEGQGFIL
jgi:hypothetical protein